VVRGGLARRWREGRRGVRKRTSLWEMREKARVTRMAVRALTRRIRDAMEEQEEGASWLWRCSARQMPWRANGRAVVRSRGKPSVR